MKETISVKQYLVVLLLLRVGLMFGQDPMVDGYAMLDAAEYDKAAVFFEDFLKSENKTARICYARALGLGGEKEKALDLFIGLNADYSDDFEVLLNLGEAYLWNNQANAAIGIYNSLLSKDSLNFVANLGYANAHASLEKNDVALEYIEKAILLNPKDKGAHKSKKYIMIAKAYSLYKNGNYDASEEWLRRINQLDYGNANAAEISQLIKDKLRTEFFTKYTNTSDAGGNNSEIYQLGSSFSLTNRHRIGVTATLQESFFRESQTARQQAISLSDHYLLNEKVICQLGLGISASKSENVILNRGLLNGGVELFLSERLYSKLTYTSEVHNYTVDLIKNDIVMRHLSGASNFMLTSKLGFYVNGVYSLQSDGNSRRLAYGSLYYSLVNAPLVRVGVNYNYFGFKEQRDNYFSPQRYQLGEFFMMIDNAQTDAKLKYKFNVSFGGQKVIGKEYQAISKVEVDVGYNFDNGISFHSNYMRNTSAAATAIGGFSYWQWSLHLSYRF